VASEPGCVVIGAGLAAAHVAQTLREEGFAEPVTILGDEGDRPYERPGLSKGYLQGNDSAESLYVHGAAWYADHDVDLRDADAATGVDLVARRVTLASGDSITYRTLVLATGATPRVPPIAGVDLAGVHTLRRRRDSDTIHAALKPGARVAVLGGGWIGLEVAAAAKQAGCEVTVLEAAPLPLQRVLGDTLGEYFAHLHRRNGVDLRTGATVEAIEGDHGVLAGVRTDQGLVPADIVVLGVGVRPNTDLLADSGLLADPADGGGVAVDEHLRSAEPNVLAAGDVANARHAVLGRSLRVEHWDNAIRQGQLAAKSILGRPDVHDWWPYFYTDQFDLGMEYVGYAGPGDEVTIRGGRERLESGEFVAFWHQDGVVTAAMNVNVWDVNEDLRKVVGKQVPPERLADASVPLTELG
jgi:3-phenylpropionate/trans-cinnamate dioxygenase ferredoxin reductase subunit